MNYKEAIEYIHSTYKFGSKLGLDNIRFLLNLMGNPQESTRFIHVAGTNGKGSTSTFLSNILMEEGYMVGLFTSPYLEVFNERIRLNGINIENADLATVTAFVKEQVDKMLALGMPHPTEFEIVTAIAMEFYKRKKVDYVILEVGMGGRLDSTNIIQKPLVSVITPIALDHTDYLGDTLGEIAYEKAGIIKKKSLVVAAPQEDEAIDVITKRSEDLKSELVVADYTRIKNVRQHKNGSTFNITIDEETLENVEIHMIGDHQVENASLALTVVSHLNRKYNMIISETSQREGLKKSRWPGRMEMIVDSPMVMIDGAHNLHGAKKLKENIERLFGNVKINAVVGILGDKDVSAILSQMMPLCDKVFVTTPNNPRAMKAEDLYSQVSKLHDNVHLTASLENAVDSAIDEAGEGILTLFFGSLYMIGDVRMRVLKKLGNKE